MNTTWMSDGLQTVLTLPLIKSIRKLLRSFQILKEVLHSESICHESSHIKIREFCFKDSEYEIFSQVNSSKCDCGVKL